MIAQILQNVFENYVTPLTLAQGIIQFTNLFQNLHTILAFM